MNIVLRPYQVDLVNKTFDRMAAGDKKIIVVASTGAGKTVAFGAITDRYIMENPGKLVLVLSHLSILTRQTFRRYKKDFPDLKVGIMQAGEFPYDECDVIISTMQSSCKDHKIDACVTYQKEKYNKSEIGLIICDEAHMSLNDSYQNIISHFPNAIIIGLTATPYKCSYLMVNYFDSVSFSISLQDLIDQGYLVPPKLNMIELDDDTSFEERCARIIDIYKRQESGKNSICFTKTIEQSNELSRMFVDAGVSCEPITCDVTGDYREDKLDEFRNGKLKVLTTVGVLREGFDAMCIESIFMLYPTKSATAWVQKIGRGLRPAPGKTECRIYAIGNPPSVKRGTYSEIQEKGLKGYKKPDIYDDLNEMKENGDTDSSEFKWTEKMVVVADRVKQLKSVGLHELIIHKNFPKRFLRNLSLVADHLPAADMDCLRPEHPPTVSQIASLKIAGFNDEQISKMKRIDATVMLSTVSNARNSSVEGDYIIKSGKFMGRHVKQLPQFYKNYVLCNYPNSSIAKMIRLYYNK